MKKGPESEHPNKQIMQFLRCEKDPFDDVWYLKRVLSKEICSGFLRTLIFFIIQVLSGITVFLVFSMTGVNE